MNLYTRRLEIRPFSRDDWQDLKRIALDFQQSEYRYLDYLLPTKDSEVRTAAAYYASTGLWFSVFIHGGDHMLGYICFQFSPGQLELGYCFHSSAHGKGYAYESISALMEVFAESGMIQRFTAGTALENTPSVRLLHRLGFVQTGTEELCLQEGHPFSGGTFEKRVDAAPDEMLK